MTSLSAEELSRLRHKIPEISVLLIDSIAFVPQESLYEQACSLSAVIPFSSDPSSFLMNLRTALAKGLETRFESCSNPIELAKRLESMHFFIRDSLAARCLIFIARKNETTKPIFSSVKQARYEALLKYITSGDFKEGSPSHSRCDLKTMTCLIESGFASYSKPSRDPYQITLVRKLGELCSLLQDSKLSV